MFERWIKWVMDPCEEKFKYQTLPSLIQQRFYQLQPSITKFNLYKADFNPSLLNEYNDLLIDQLYCVTQNEQCPRFSSYYDINVRANIYPSMEKFLPNLSYRCYQNSSCSCSKELFNQFNVIKNITVSHIPSKITFASLPLFKKISPRQLIITHSVLTVADLQLISSLKLDFIKLNLLFDGTNFENKMQQIMNAVIGTPNIRTQYDCICEDDDAFEVFMFEWISNNEYVESIKCRQYLQLLCFGYKKSKSF
uniref:Uncharacterized protein n=1 Tax=Panagrolaimus davidi TaxID=227884 RepID=A0A914Q3N7_9BILA